MKVVIVGPVPGIAPNRQPTAVPRIIGKNACFSSALVGRMSFMLHLGVAGLDLTAVDGDEEVGDAEQAQAQARRGRCRRASSLMPKV